MQALSRAVTALLLCLLMEPYPLIGSDRTVSGPAASHGRRNKMSRQESALHLLNRLAFGPRPGEVDAVAAMGVNRWIDLQLNPEKIDDSSLEQRLAEYPAPFLTPAELMLDFPPGNLIRQALNGRIAVPPEEPQHAVWESQMAIVRQRQLATQAAANKPALGDQASRIPAQQNPAPQEPAMAAATPEAVSTGMAQAASPSQSLRKSYAEVEASELAGLSPQQRYQALLATPPGRLQEFVRSVPPRERPAIIAGLTPAQRDTVFALLNPRLVVVNETESVRLLEDIYSAREVERVMTEFWLNHFNVFVGKNEVEPYYIPQFEQDVIAPHALGKFEDLLDAVAESPAMLLYLDNQESVGPDSRFALRRKQANKPQLRAQQRKAALPGINENYGRELMELHTVGVNGGYTQQDVIEAAKVLTGWTVAPPQQGGGFLFAENRHEPGTKVVMGHKIKQDGQQEGLELLHMLATSPSTAHFLSQELAMRFVSDHPSQALVDHMAKTFLSTDGDIGAVLRTMLHSPEFWAAANRGNKVKTPLDYVISAARATDANVSQPFRLVAEIKIMGMPLDGTQEPNGYSMSNAAWNSSSELIDRMNFALALASNRIPGVAVSWANLLGEQEESSQTPQQQESLLEQAILHEDASSQVHEAILTSLLSSDAQDRAAAIQLRGDGGGSPFAPGLLQAKASSASAREMSAQEALIAGLLIGSPQFQIR